MHRSAPLAACVALLLGAACSRPAPGPQIETREVTYNVGGNAYQGVLAWNAADTSRRPGVIVVHEWWGLNDHTRAQARRLAAAGYVAFAVDMYGEGKSTTHPQDAAAFAGAATKDPAEVAARFAAGVALLRQDAHVDPERIGAIGHCFGGMVVLSMARAGSDLDAVVSFHGALPAGPVDSGAVKGRVLVVTGGADAFVPQAAVDKFVQDWRRVADRLEVVVLPDVKHGFTNPAAGSYGMEQLAYDAAADSSSWRRARELFGEVWR